MNRVVVVGGFGNGRLIGENIGNSLLGQYDEFDTFTFATGMDNPDILRKAVKGVPVVCHSAALIALQGTFPELISAFNPPLPSSRGHLLRSTLKKTAAMHSPRSVHNAEDLFTVVRFDASSTAELAVHPVANLRPFLRNIISRFDAIETACHGNSAGVPIEIITTGDDEYFPYGQSDINRAAINKIPLFILPGVHDELPLRPEQTIRNYDLAKSY